MADKEFTTDVKIRFTSDASAELGKDIKKANTEIRQLAKGAESVRKARLSDSLKIGMDTQERIEGVRSAVADATRQIEDFRKNGGIGALAVGSEKIDAASASLRVLAIDLEKNQRTITKLRAEIIELESGFGDMTDEARQSKLDFLRRELANVENSSARMREEIKRLPRDLRESVTDAVGYLGDLDTSIRTITGAGAVIGQAVGGQLGAALQGADKIGVIVSEVFGAAEALPRLQNAIGQLRSVSPKAGQAIASLASSIFSPGGLALAAVATVATAAMVGLNKVLGDSQQELKDLVRAEKERIEITKQVQGEIAGLTADEARNRLEELRVIRDSQQSALEALRSELNRLNTEISLEAGATRLGDWVGVADDGIEDLRSGIKELTGGLTDTITEMNLIGTNLERLEAIEALKLQRDNEIETYRILNTMTAESIRSRLEELEVTDRANQAYIEGLEQERSALERLIEAGGEGQDVELLSQELIILNTNLRVARSGASEVSREIELLNDAFPQKEEIEAQTRSEEQFALAREMGLETVQSALEDARKAEEDRNAALEETTQKMNEARNAALDTKRALSEQEAAWREEEERIASRSAQLGALEEKLEQALDAEKAQQEAQKLIDAEREINEKRIDITKKSNVEIENLNRKFSDDIAKETLDFNEENAKLLSDYRKEELRAEKEFAQERDRINRDLREKLLDAQTQNDVVAFINAQNAAEKQLNEQQEQFSEETQERKAQLEEEKVLLRKNHEDNLRELAQAKQKELLALRESSRKEIITLQQSIEKKQELLQEGAELELTASQKIRQEIARLQDRFAEEDAMRRRNLERQSFIDRINQARDEYNTLLRQQQEFSQARINIDRQMLIAINEQARASVNAFSSTRAGVAGLPGAHRRQARILLNADGGIHTQPTLSMLGERPGYGDIVIPFQTQRSEGIQNALQSAMNMAGNGGGSRISAPITVQNLQLGAAVTQYDVDAAMSMMEQNVINTFERVARDLGIT